MKVENEHISLLSSAIRMKTEVGAKDKVVRKSDRKDKTGGAGKEKPSKNDNSNSYGAYCTVSSAPLLLSQSVSLVCSVHSCWKQSSVYSAVFLVFPFH